MKTKSRQRVRYGWGLTFWSLACLASCGGSSQSAPDGGSGQADSVSGRLDARDGGAPDGAAKDAGAAGSSEAGADGASGGPDAADPSDGGAAGAPDASVLTDGALDMTGGATAGASGTTGGGGAAGSAGSSGGTAGAAGGTSGAGGTAAAAGTSGATCGDVGQPCCASNACNGDLACLGGTTCSCVGALHGHYVVRTDHKALLEIDDASKTQRPVLDATSGSPLDDVASIHEGYAHACAVLGSAKTAWCWRTDASGNNYGQLGSGAIDTNGAVFRASQVLAAASRPLTNVTAIAQSYTPYYSDVHQVTTSCAVTGDGHLYCWGDLKYLVAGGAAKSSPYAVPVTSNGSTPLAGVLAVSLSTDFACALLQGALNKEVWCWGSNGSTEVLGQGDQDFHPYPAKVLGLTNPSKVVTGDSTACALDGGHVRCWGYNLQGEAGVGNLKTPVHSPTSVILMGGATPMALGDLSAGNDANGGSTSFCALDATAEKVLCWGTGFQDYASLYAVPGIVAVGAVDSETNGRSLVRALTSDGLYRVGAVTRQPNCGALP